MKKVTPLTRQEKMEKKLAKNKDDDEENEHLLRMITAEKLIQDLRKKEKEDLLKFRKELLKEMEEVMKGEALNKNYSRLQEIKDKVDIFVDRKIEYWRDNNYYYFLTPQPRMRKSGQYMAEFDKVLDVDVLDKGGKFTLAALKDGKKYKNLNRPWLKHLTEEEKHEVTDKLFYLEKFMYDARTTGKFDDDYTPDMAIKSYEDHRKDIRVNPWIYLDNGKKQHRRTKEIRKIRESDFGGGRRRKTRRKRRRRRRKSTKKRRRKRNLKKRTGRRKSKRRRRR
tara:strand:+ start:132 stop:971 length:840 start_codon:yes stop_codon:yes gene_type:complete